MPHRATKTTRTLLACGAVGGPLFVLLFLVAGATRAQYDPWRHPVSALAIGEFGWTQAVNFLLTGALMLAFAVGLRRALRPPSFWGPLLVGLFAVGLVGAGLFVTDPLNGYPPGTPLLPTARNLHSRVHDLFGVPVFLGLPAACLVLSRWFARRNERGWALYSALSGLAMFAAFVVAGLGFRQLAGLAELAGLFQRLSLLCGWGWITLLASHLLRPSEPENRS